MAARKLTTLLADAGVITHVQVATEGRWEDARRVVVDRITDHIDFLTTPLGPNGELAIEVFAADNDGCQTFVGVRFTDSAPDAVGRLTREVCESAEGGTLERVAHVLSDCAGKQLFDGPWTRVEVGVVDAWASLGSIDLCARFASKDARDVRSALMHVAGQLRPPAGRVVAAEFAVDGPLAHWVGVEVARSHDGGLTESPSSRRVVEAIRRGT